MIVKSIKQTDDTNNTETMYKNIKQVIDKIANSQAVANIFTNIENQVTVVKEEVKKPAVPVVELRPTPEEGGPTPEEGEPTPEEDDPTPEERRPRPFD